MGARQSQHVQIYTQAIFELAKENAKVDEFLAEFEMLQALQEKMHSLKTFLELPLFDHEERVKFIEDTFQGQFSTMFLNFLKILVTKNHFGLFPKIFNLYRKLADEYANRVRATAISVVPLPEEKVQEIAQLLRKKPEQTVVIHNQLDPEILGGLIIQLGDLWIDDSIERQVELLRRQMVKNIPKNLLDLVAEN